MTEQSQLTLFMHCLTVLGISTACSVASANPLEYTSGKLLTDQHKQTGKQLSHESETLEKVIVKGSKRNTELMKSDLSVTLIDSALINEARLRDFSRIDDLAPNVQFNESGQRGSIYITIRGVESNPFIVNRAAVYIDGIPFRELSNSVLNQVDSIEVLRGPQGTLYGANSESGLIIVNTKTPSDVFEQNYRIAASDYHSGQGYEATGFISGPLINKELSGSVSFSSAYEDAFVKNIGTSTGDTGNIKENYIQGRLHWTPSDSLSINATTYWLDMDAPGLFDQQYVPLNINLYNQLYADNYNQGQQIDDWTVLEDAPKYTNEEEFVAGISATYKADYGDIDLAASYRSLEEDAKGLDLDLTAAPIVAGREAESEDYKNIELRFTSPTGNHFDYIVGLSYYSESEENTKSTFLGAGTLNSYLAAPMQYKEGKDKSVFGSINWYLTEKFKIGAGLRYDNAKRSAIQTEGELNLGFGTVTRYQDAHLSETFSAWLPKVSALYQYANNLSFHASLSKGYIPGGFNLTAVQDDKVDDNVFTYDSETLVSRELGYKWFSTDKKWRSSGAIFYIQSDNWQEIQIATDANGRPISSDYISSDASIISKGIEMELTWRPVKQFSVSGHIGYVNAEYDNLQLSESLNVKGQPIQFVPEYDAGLAARYQWDDDFYFRVEANFTGKTALRSRGDIFQKATAMLGLQLGYDSGEFAIRIFGENLTNERRASGLAVENMAFGTDGLFYSPLDAPRVIGLEAEVWL
ncbi:TonB-dependent receptor [Bowmanella denitrificans]|uniref:TonB-dependent receptor n=1 Tax=Bowmanella denitrificans TaxID=366582 RepID=UPI000C999816|nr:TonB-dependent receptor [Bowmanella denitrificans]